MPYYLVSCLLFQDVQRHTQHSILKQLNDVIEDIIRVTRQSDHWSGGPYALGVIIISTAFVIGVLCLLRSPFIPRDDDTKMENQIFEYGRLLRLHNELENIMTTTALDIKHTITANEQKVISIEDSVRQLGTAVNELRIQLLVLADNYKEYKDSNKNQHVIVDGRVADMAKQISNLIIDQRVNEETTEFLWSQLEKTLKESREASREEAAARFQREERERRRDQEYREQGRKTEADWRKAPFSEKMIKIGKSIFSLFRRILL